MYICFAGIARHVEDRGLGEWFGRLQAVLAERASNNPGTVVEPVPGAQDLPNSPPHKRSKTGK